MYIFAAKPETKHIKTVDLALRWKDLYGYATHHDYFDPRIPEELGYKFILESKDIDEARRFSLDEYLIFVNMGIHRW